MFLALPAFPATPASEATAWRTIGPRSCLVHSEVEAPEGLLIELLDRLLRLFLGQG